MPIDYATNLTARLNALDFAVAIGTTTLSSDFQTVTVAFEGSANPAITSGVDITGYEYSMDSGETWSTMTIDSGSSDTANLTFDTDGESYSILWNAKTDLGSEIYNNSIRIRLTAQATFGTDVVSVTGTKYITFTRVSTNLIETSDSPFPDSYQGTPGDKLLENAPRQ